MSGSDTKPYEDATNRLGPTDGESNPRKVVQAIQTLFEKLREAMGAFEQARRECEKYPGTAWYNLAHPESYDPAANMGQQRY